MGFYGLSSLDFWETHSENFWENHPWNFEKIIPGIFCKIISGIFCKIFPGILGKSSREFLGILFFWEFPGILGIFGVIPGNFGEIIPGIFGKNLPGNFLKFLLNSFRFFSFNSAILCYNQVKMRLNAIFSLKFTQFREIVHFRKILQIKFQRNVYAIL